MRLEGWPVAWPRLLPSFETAAPRGRPPQDEGGVCFAHPQCPLHRVAAGLAGPPANDIRALSPHAGVGGVASLEPVIFAQTPLGGSDANPAHAAGARRAFAICRDCAGARVAEPANDHGGAVRARRRVRPLRAPSCPPPFPIS